MTLRFIVGRILRELIELAERDADAELVDALDVAMPASSNGTGTAIPCRTCCSSPATRRK